MEVGRATNHKYHLFNNLPVFVTYAGLFLVFCYVVVFTFYLNLNRDGYILGDWVINYQDGGFKRRGLAGEIVFAIQDLSGLSIVSIVLAIQMLVILVFFIYFIRILRSKAISWPFVTILYSALGFVGLLNTVSYVGKKEFILFALFSVFIYWILSGKLNRARENVILLSLFISVFLHEIVIFFIPYFILIHAITYKKKWTYYIKYLIAIGIPAILIFFWGSDINNGKTYEILKARGLVFHEKTIFDWYLIDEKEVLRERLQAIIPYLVGPLLSALHVWLYLHWIQAKRNRNLIWGFVGAIVFSLPLFYLALDWGRWWYIHMVMITLTLAFLLPEIKSQPVALQNLPKNTKRLVSCILIIFVSMCYKVDLSGAISPDGLLYRVWTIEKQVKSLAL